MRALFFTFLLCAGYVATAQTAFKDAIDDFHMTLGFTYHPMADDQNYNPIRKRSGELFEKALAMERSLYQLEEVDSLLEVHVELLTESCAQLHQEIEDEASDEDIYKNLSAIHDLFHYIEDLYRRFEEKREKQR